MVRCILWPGNRTSWSHILAILVHMINLVETTSSLTNHLILVNTSLDYFYTSSLKSILLNHCSSLCLLKSFPFSWIWHWTHWGFTTWAISSSSKCIEFSQSSFWHHCRDGTSVFNTLPLATVTIQPIWFV